MSDAVDMNGVPFNVVDMSGNPMAEPNQRLIAVLEAELERARGGDTRGVSIVRLHSDNSSSYQLAGAVGGYSMLGAMEMVKTILVRINEE